MTFFRILIISALCLVTGCTSNLGKEVTTEVEQQTVAALGRYQFIYTLTPGDQIEVVVDRRPELSRAVFLRPDGWISYPKIGDVELAGLTIEEAAGLLEQKLGARLIDPEVVVVLLNPPPPQVFVTGQVGQARPVDLREAPTAAMAVVAAGGLTDRSANRNAIIVRLQPNGELTATPIKPAKGGAAGLMLALQNVPMQSGDMVIVQESTRSKFTRNVQDYVNTPLSTVNQLLAPYLQIRLIEEINDS